MSEPNLAAYDQEHDYHAALAKFWARCLKYETPEAPYWRICNAQALYHTGMAAHWARLKIWRRALP